MDKEHTASDCVHSPEKSTCFLGLARHCWCFSVPFAMAMVLLANPSARGTIIVRFDPPQNQVNHGETLMVNLVADLGNEPVIGWGLDVAFDPVLLSQVGGPAIGPFWETTYTPDGDGLTGSVNPFSDPDQDGTFGSVSGNDVLLATLTFLAVGLGQTNLTASYTLTDLNEGFPLDSTGFATVIFQPAQIQVTPEPTTVALIVAGAFFWARRRPSPSSKTAN